MKLTDRQQGEVTVIGVEGRLDANNSSSLESKFLQLVEQGNSRFIFDFIGLEYVSSAGLRSILVAAKKIKTIKGSLALIQMNENVKEVFDMSGFSTIFSIYATEAEAVQAIG
jgi:anti-sigma B factor antagonist